mmetsp:Transcript_13641/g.17967  ORF Transcript_13641/g.17967 Transcript_13641/m.17967 type:complete len:360 (-) Transcript_13641:366-1445(-)
MMMMMKSTDCSFFIKFSSCNKGEACSFRHSFEAKSTLLSCATWISGAECDGSCGKRHPDQRRGFSHHSRPKRKRCHFFATQGACAHGANCTFDHQEDSLDILPHQDDSLDFKFIEDNNASECNGTHKNSETAGGGSNMPFNSEGGQEEEEDDDGDDEEEEEEESVGNIVPILWAEDRRILLPKNNGQDKGSPESVRKIIPNGAGNSLHSNQTESSCAPVDPRKSFVCKFFMNGFCRSGQSCPFHHPQKKILHQDELPAPVLLKTAIAPNSSIPNPSRPPCHFFQLGRCLKGSSCSFSHHTADSVSSSSQEIDDDKALSTGHSSSSNVKAKDILKKHSISASTSSQNTVAFKKTKLDFGI